MINKPHVALVGLAAAAFVVAAIYVEKREKEHLFSPSPRTVVATRAPLPAPVPPYIPVQTPPVAVCPDPAQVPAPRKTVAKPHHTIKPKKPDATHSKPFSPFDPETWLQGGR